MAEDIRDTLNATLVAKPPVRVVMPVDADLLLSLIRIGDTDNDQVTRFFADYFEFGKHTIIFPPTTTALDEQLLACRAPEGARDFQWPWNDRAPCVRIAGTRHGVKGENRIRRLFVADLAWLFYFERLGVFQILGQILDEFAYGGGIPVSNGTSATIARDDVVALVLEAMVRQMETGAASKLRDRESSYRRCLGWTSDAGRSLTMNSVVNAGFNTLFHRFIASALAFYRDKRLAVAIRDASAPNPTLSVATLVEIGDILSLFKRSFDSFDFGRNYSNTLSGLVWVIAAMSVVRELRSTIGIPTEYNKPEEYIPAAYDILVLKRPITPADSNRYQAHRDCADAAREILLGIEALNGDDMSSSTQLEPWLNMIERKVETYRSAYRSLTGIELGAQPLPAIQQQAS